MSNLDFLATPSSQLTPGESDNKQQQPQSNWLYLPGGEWEAKRYGETTERIIQGWHCLSHMVSDAVANCLSSLLS